MIIIVIIIVVISVIIIIMDEHGCSHQLTCSSVSFSILGDGNSKAGGDKEPTTGLPDLIKMMIPMLMMLMVLMLMIFFYQVFCILIYGS